MCMLPVDLAQWAWKVFLSDLASAFLRAHYEIINLLRVYALVGHNTNI